jgi:hypothetical protein
MRRPPKAGDRVRIGHDLTSSYSRYGRSPHDEMEGMKGKVYQVVSSTSNRARIRPSKHGFAYSFFYGDLEWPEPEVEMPGPVVFEPDKLLWKE